MEGGNLGAGDSGAGESEGGLKGRGEKPGTSWRTHVEPLLKEKLRDWLREPRRSLQKKSGEMGVLRLSLNYG